MAVALAEADDLVLDRGAIARAAALDLPGIHRRTMHVGPDDGVGGLGGAGDAALDLRILDAFGQRRERLRRLVAGLHLQARPVDGAAVEARRGAGLQPSERKADALQGPRQADGGRLADPAGRGLLLADMDQAAQERAGGQDHGAGPEFAAIGQANARDPRHFRSADRRPRLR